MEPRKKHNLLENIVNYPSEREKLQNFGNRADHAINSVINLLDSIESEFDEETAVDLRRRLILSIKKRDYRKFEKGLENIAHNKNKRGSNE